MSAMLKTDLDPPTGEEREAFLSSVLERVNEARALVDAGDLPEITKTRHTGPYLHPLAEMLSPLAPALAVDGARAILAGVAKKDGTPAALAETWDTQVFPVAPAVLLPRALSRFQRLFTQQIALRSKSS